MMKKSILYLVLFALLLWSQSLVAQLSTAIQEVKMEPVCVGASTTIELVTSQANLSFQWQVREDRYFHPIASDDARFQGSNSSALQILAAEAGVDFLCIINDGEESIQTAPIRLNINNPIIRRQPRDKVAYLHDNFSMTMVTTGLFLTYQWQIEQNGTWIDLIEGAEFTNTQAATLVIPEVTAKQNGKRFRCIVTGGDCGTKETIISAVGRITVLEETSPLKSRSNSNNSVIWYSNQKKTYINGNPTIFVNGSVQVTGKIVNDPVTSNYFFLAQDGNDMYVTGDIINDGHNSDTNPNYLVNENTYLFHPVADKTKLIMTGGSDAAISGSSDLTTIYHLKTEKGTAANQVDLQHDIHIRSQVELGTGDIDLNGKEMELDFTPNNVMDPNTAATLSPGTAGQFPQIINETEDNRIVDSAPSLTSGGIYVGQLLDNGFGGASSPLAGGYDFGNIGLEITANGAGGATTSFAADMITIYRRLTPLAVTNTLNSIDRFYIFDKQNAPLASDEFGVKLRYLDNDFNGLDESGFSIYHNETNTLPFANIAPDNVDAGANVVTANSVAEIEGYWSLAECADTPEISFDFPQTDICWGDTVTIPVNLTDGTAASYIWTLDGVLNAQTSSSFTIIGSADSLATQTLEVVVISNLGCRAVLTHTINHLPTPFVDLGSDVYLCENENLVLDAQNNQMGTSYAWTIDGVAAGTDQTLTYNTTGSMTPVEIIVGVTNALGCTQYDTIMVTEAVNPIVDLGNTQTACQAGATITLNATPSNSQVGDIFDYDWSTTAATASIMPAITATNSNYMVTVTNTVTSCSAVASIDALLSEISLSTTQTNVDCFGESTGTIDLTASSTEATATFSYLWDNNETTEDLDNLMAGNYNVTVSDNYACTATLDLPVSITQPANALTASPALTHVACHGGNDGLISSNPAGGTPPYSFLWNNGATTQDITTLTAGTYNLTITDNLGCTTDFSETVTEPAAISATFSLTHVICHGAATGAIDVTVSGGTSPFSYLWSEGSTSEDLSNIPAGFYEITITDVNSCTAVFSETINENPAISFDVETLINVTCHGAADGSITLDNSTTGIVGLTFAWLGQNTGVTATGNPITNLAPDTYDVTVTNINNCTATFSYTITEPALLAVSNTNIVNAAGCVDNGAIDITVAGGTTPYTYAWSNGATTQNIGALGGGDYTVTITDANDCTYTETYNVSAPDGIVVTETQIDVSCHGAADGALSVVVSGGVSPYSYAWSLANGTSNNTNAIDHLIPGNYQLIVTDDIGCTSSNIYMITQPDVLILGGTENNISCYGFNDGSIQTTVMGGTMPYNYQWSANAGGVTTADLTNLSPANYTMTLTDNNGCTEIEIFTITEPPILMATPTVITDLNCFNDTDAVLSAGASGGTMPYTYQWNGGPNTAFYSNVGGGTYEVTVTDMNGCSVSNSVTLTPPSQISITLVSQSNVSAFGGSDGAIDISVSGGQPGTNPAYTFTWTDSGNNAVANTEDISNLSADTYTLVVTDDNGCTETANYTITEPGLLEIILDNTTNVSCHSGNDGSIDVTIMGGVSPFTYVWSIATNGNYAVTEDLTGVPADTYSLLVTDVNGTTATLMPTVTITEPSQLTATNANFDVSCHQGNDGSISITANSGTPPYSYIWSNGAANNSQITNLMAGTYAVTITDNNACTTEIANMSIGQPNAITLSALLTNVSIFGGTDGGIDLSAAGGTPPFTFDWDNDGTIGDMDPEDIDNLSAGTYTVVATDANGCSASESYGITEPSAIVITIEAANDPLCNGENTGNIDVSVMGGVLPYTYAWSNGATTEDLSNIPMGSYTMTVTDDNGATKTQNVVLNEPALLTETAVVTDLNCFNGNNGSIQVTANGGTTPYSYLWSNGVTTSGNANLTADIYDLTITDANNCEVMQNYTINEPAEITISEIITDVTINGGSDGAIDVTIAGGTPGYTYAWSNGITSADLNNVSAGDYDITVTDANGCTQSASFTVNEPSPLLVTLNTANDISCFGAADGTIDIDVSGAVSPYTYAWDNGATTEDLVNLIPGTYQITITDSNGATVSLNNAVTITEPVELTDNPATITNVSCNGGNDGNITMNPTGGTLPYSYHWANGLGSNPAINNLTQGIYEVTITDANGCSIIRNNTVMEPPGLTISEIITNVTIFGQATGAVDISPTGGTPAYSFLWSNNETTEDITNVTAGMYSLTLTDMNGCTLTDTHTITEPDELLISTNIASDPSCNGFADGALSVHTMGGVMPYLYDWDNDGTGDNDDSDALSGLTVGTYNLVVTDANGATATHTITLNEPAVLTSSEVTQDISCHGGSDGSIVVTGAGGTAPYAILWDDGTTDLVYDNLTAGTYDYTLTDDNNCSTTGTATLVEPTALIATETITQVSCPSGNDGQVSVVVSGGTPPYNYLWSNTETTSSIDNLSFGNYHLTITDANNCTLTTNYIVTEPTEITMNVVNSTDANCGQSDGSLTVEAMGGTAPYAYQWTNPSVTGATLNNIPAGNYEVIVTDANGCTQAGNFSIMDVAGPSLSIANQTDIACFGESTGSISTTILGGTAPLTYLWSNNATTAAISNLAAGFYALTVTDGVGCTATTSATLTENSLLTSNIVGSNVSCFQGTDGSADLFVNGGVSPYTFNWSNGATTEDLSNSSAGAYAVTITDNVGCTMTNTVTLTEPTELLAGTATITDALCFGDNNGSITVNPLDGTPPYNYLWANGLGISATINNLTAGAYTVTITDNNGCTVEQTNTLSEPANLAITGTIMNVAIFGGATGAIDITATGGTPSYTFSWDNGATTQNLSNLTAGAYEVTITDHNGCTTTEIFTITQPDELVVMTNTVIDPTCNGFTDGSLSVIVSGGTMPYLYDWDNDGTGDNDDSDVLTNLSADVYNLTVTDANDGTATHTITLGEPSLLTISENTQNISCHGESDGIISIIAAGGTPPYSILWNTGASSMTLTNLTAGAYDYIVTDAQGCTMTNTVTLTEPAIFIATDNITHATCDGFADGQIDLTTVGGTMPYTYNWNIGQTTEDLTNLSAGVYEVSITDANNCEFTATYTVDQPMAIMLNLVSSTDANCGQSDGSLTVEAMGGTAPYAYQWTSPSITGATLNNIPAGTYEVIVTDEAGCTQAESFSISDLNGPTLTLNAQVNVDCFGDNTGAINVSTTGGAAPLSYLWSNGETTESIADLTAGIYSLTLTDGVGCLATLSTEILENDILSSNIIPTNASCFGIVDGAADLFVSGGVSPYLYLWSNGATSQNLANIAIGTYEVTISDNVGCTATNMVTLTEPPVLTTNPAIVANVSCHGASDGSITVNPIGGTPPYTYLWANGLGINGTVNNLTAGNYEVTITDNNGCSIVETMMITEPNPLAISSIVTNATIFNVADGAIDITVIGGAPPYSFVWSNGATTEDLAAILAGTYDVTVTDMSGCTLVETFLVIQPDELLITTNTAIDPTCNGFMDGELSVSVAGGVLPFLYDWDNDGIGDNDDTDALTGLSTGVYNLVVTDANGAIATHTITLGEPMVLSTTESTQNISCNGGNDGAIALVAAGGTAPYAVIWSTGESTMTINNLMAGTYDYTITDHQGCEFISSVILSEPFVIGATENIISVTCNGGSDGEITLTTIGGTTPYNYVWSNGQTTSMATGLTAGTYSVTITDAQNCVFTDTYDITQPTPISINLLNSVDANCGQADGSLAVEGMGGTAPYTYQWTNPAVSGSILPNISSGAYEVMITDAVGCTMTQTFTISDIAGPILAVDSQTNIDCFGDNTGTIFTTITGGTPPFSYLWSNGGATSTNLTGLIAGVYALTVTDDAGCIATLSAEILQNDDLVSTIIGTDISCYQGTDGSANLTVTGGVAPYNYNWSNGVVSEDLTNVPDGTYEVTITDAVGCSTIGSIALNQPAELTYTEVIVPVTCFGAGDGEINLMMSGGVPPYNYMWADTGINTNIRSNLEGGTYDVAVIDQNNCIIIISFIVPEPNVILLTNNVTNSSCFGDNSGEVEVLVTNGSGNFMYYVRNRDTGIQEPPQINNNLFTNLAPGEYSVYVSELDGSFCNSELFFFTITEAPELVVNSTTTSVSCSGQAEGSIDLNIQGGTPNYNINWSNGATGMMINNLLADIYSATITDANSCTAVVTETISEPDDIVIIESIDSISCNGAIDASIALSVTGGSGNFAFAWSTGQITDSLANLGVGTYEVTVSDVNSINCTATASFILTEPSILSITNANIIEASCGGLATGEVDITFVGGTAPFTFDWTDASGNSIATTEDLTNSSSGDFTITITDANGCTISETYTINSQATIQVTVNTVAVSCGGEADGEAYLAVTGGNGNYTFAWSGVLNSSDQNQTGLAAGNYQVTVNDTNGSCEQIVNITINEPDPIAITNQMVTDVTCAGASAGSFSFDITGGPSGSYVFDWENVDGSFSDQTLIPQLSNLPAGTYTVMASDSPCVLMEEFTITETDILEASVAISIANCSTTATVTASGGIMPYHYSISPDPNSQSGSNNVFDDLPAGNYSLIIEDAVGCQVSESFTVDDNDDIVVMSNLTDISCAGLMDGAIEIIASNPDLTYAWSISGAGNTNLVENLAAGNYEVTVTNNVGCSEELSFTLTAPTAIVIDTISYTPDICFGTTDGEITIAVIGGNNPSISWSEGTTNQTALNNLPAGNYSVTVGEGGCEVIADFVLNSQSEINISLVAATDPSCGSSNGYLEIIASGGNSSSYSYEWSGGMPNNMAFIENLDAGDYTVTVTDGNICTATANFTLSAPNALTATATVTNITCFGGNDGSITIDASGGIGQLTYSIDGSNFQTDNNFNGLDGGSYIVSVQDADGCTFNAGTFDITEPAGILLISGMVSSNSGIGLMDGAIDLTVAGGEPPYDFTWDNGLTTEDLMNLLEGAYSVTVTDNRGCEITETFTVTTISTGVMAIATNLTDISCFDSNNGELEVVITGGVAPYAIIWTYPDGSTVLDQNIIQNLAPGAYSVEVTDANGLMESEDMLLLTNPQELTGSVAATDACTGLDNGILTFNVNGGSLPYTYEWTINSMVNSVSNNDPDIDEVTDLMAGNYLNISIMDANGCSIQLADQFIDESPGITISVDMQSDVTCFGLMDGSVMVSAMGGVVSGNYNYVWTDDTGNPVGSVSNLNNLMAGTYTVAISDDVGCSTTEDIIITEPAELMLDATSSNIDCFGDATGSIVVNSIMGGSGSGYTWTWEDGTMNTNDRPNLIAGNYALTLSDDNGCTESIDFDLVQPIAALSLTVSVEDESCFGEENGFISVVADGGTMPYDYIWSDGQDTDLAIELAPDNYTLTVTDDNGCQIILDTVINAAQELLVSSTTLSPSCFGFSDGAIDLNVSGGTPDYEFDWGGIFSEDLSAIGADDYSVTITYNNGLCEHIEDISLTQPAAMTIAPQITDVSCFGESNGMITLNAIGGTGDLTYDWNTGDQSSVLSTLAAGTYGVTITDANNCEVSFTDEITQPDLLVVTSLIQRAGCKTTDDGSIILDVEGGTVPYSFDWSNGSTDATAVNLVTNNYQVTIFDANDCMVEQDLLVAEADTIFTAKFLAASGLANVDSVEVNADDQIHFRDVSFPNPIEWEWSFGDEIGSMSTEASPVFSFENNPAENESAYTVKLIVSNQFCTDSLEKVIQITNNLRIRSPKQDSIVYLKFTEMTAFPNPTNDIINVNIEMTREEKVQLTIFDALGQLYYEKALENDERYETVIDVRNLPAGIYFIRAKALNRVHTLKMIVAR